MVDNRVACKTVLLKWSHLVQGFCAKRGRGGDELAKARLGMGAGKEVSVMDVDEDGTTLTLFDLESWWCTALGWMPRKACGGHGRMVNFSALTEYVSD